MRNENQMQRKLRAPHRFRGPASILVALLAAGCSASPEGGSLAPADSGSGPAAPDTLPLVNPLGRARCHAPPGVSASPKSTDEAIQLLNALPKPTSVACFLESLDRPIIAYASSSVFSAQPALSVESPRLFLKLGRLWLSVVIDGESSYLMEFGERLSPESLHSIKGELQLPVDGPVAATDAYERVRYGKGTVCGLCHYDENAMTDSALGQAFSSIAFRPRAETRVSIDGLRSAASVCDWQKEPHRCEMLSALFDGGAVSEEAFPAAMPTFF